MAGGGLDGVALGSIAAGGLFLFAAVKGISVLKSLQNLIKGSAPATGQQTAQDYNPAAGGIYPTPAGTQPASLAELGGNSGSVEATLQQAAAKYGWGSGAQWQALVNVENAEAGFNPDIVNSTSGALGLAQALGHGDADTAGTLGNEYGGYGLTAAQAVAANSGDAAAQALWMVDYIAATYGTPEAAWAHEQANGWY